MELILVARKPLSERTLAANVLRHGTGALNIDAARIATSEETGRTRNTALGIINDDGWQPTPGFYEGASAGRWPANVATDGSDEVLEAFAAFGSGKGAAAQAKGPSLTGKSGRSCMAGNFNGTDRPAPFYGDTGTAARFFFSAKATKADRAGSRHPTVKPLDLMRWLVRMVTPPGGTVLDPFAGTGVTGEACLREGFSAVLVEREAEYHRDILRRLGRMSGADTPLFTSAAE